MNYYSALFLGIILFLLVDCLGSFLSRKYMFNYSWLSIVSLAFAFSPIYVTDNTTSPFLAWQYTMIILAPETLLGFFVATKIKAYCGKSGFYRDINNDQMLKSYFGSIGVWLILSFITYLIK